MGALVAPSLRSCVLLACAVAAWAPTPAHAAVTNAVGALEVTAGNADATLTLASTATGVHVAGAGGSGTGCTADGAGGLDCPGAASVRVVTGSGDDDIDLSGLTTPTTIEPGKGVNTIQGGQGPDHLVYQEGWDDEFHGGPGHDVITTEQLSAPVFVSAGDGGASLRVDGTRSAWGTSIEEIDGTSGEDGFSGVGDLRGFAFYAGAGKDAANFHYGAHGGRIDGGPGDDLVSYRWSWNEGESARLDLTGGDEGDVVLTSFESAWGGYGDDTFITGDEPGGALRGGWGDDVFIVGNGARTVQGESGRDVIDYSRRDTPVHATFEYINAVPGEPTPSGDHIAVDVDKVIGTRGDDVLEGNPLPNMLDGGPGDDVIVGNAGLDVLDGGPGNDRVDGGDNEDVIDGGAGDDHLDGGNGHDRLAGGAGADTLQGGLLDDTLDGGPGADSLSGGSGHDTADYSARSLPVSVSLDDQPNDGGAGEGDNVASDVQVISGGSAGDFLAGGPTSETLEGNGGDDVLAGGSAGTNVLIGGDGFDTASYAGVTAPVTAQVGSVGGVAGQSDRLVETEALTGGSGDDKLAGDVTPNALDGGPGDDRLDGAGGPDVLRGGPGTDRAVYAGRATPVRAVIGGGPQSGEAGEGDAVQPDVEELEGGFAADVLVGDGAANALIGGPGADTLSGGGGDDSLLGGPGADRFDGGPGADALMLADGARGDVARCPKRDDDVVSIDAGDTAAGCATLLGHPAPKPAGTAGRAHAASMRTAPAPLRHRTGTGAADHLRGNSGRDRIEGGASGDVLRGLGGDDILRGGRGPDRLFGGAGNDRLHGDTGPDVIDGGSGNDVAHGDEANDRMLGRGGDDALFGDTGTDSLNGGPGADVLTGATGDDVLTGADGDDTLIGGFGHDSERGGGGDDVLDGAEAPDRLDGGAGDDRLDGGSGPDFVWGADGNDILSGGSGRDDILGGAGDDVVYANDGGLDSRIDCGPGHDRVVLEPRSSAIGRQERRRLRAGLIADCEVVSEEAPPARPASEGVLIITGAAGDARSGTERNDKLLGGAGPDLLVGGAGDDLLWGDHKPGTAAADQARGGLGRDKIYGGGGPDFLDGGPDADYVQGDAGDDVLRGGDGADQLRPGAGTDVVDAGPGNDVVYAIGGGRDRVDCGPGRDRAKVDRGDVITGCESVSYG